jgi:hypothetical protein
MWQIRVWFCTSCKLPFGLEAAGPAIPPALATLVAQASPNDIADKVVSSKARTFLGQWLNQPIPIRIFRFSIRLHDRSF